MTTNRQSINDNSWLFWLTMGYLGSTTTNVALGRNAPTQFSNEFSKLLSTNQGKKFVSTTPEELQAVRNNLRKPPPKAPGPPPYNIYCGVVHNNPLFKELLNKVKQLN